MVSYALWPRVSNIQAGGTSDAKLSPLYVAAAQLVAECNAPLLDLSAAADAQRGKDSVTTRLIAAALFGSCTEAPVPVAAWQVLQLAVLMVSEQGPNTVNWDACAATLTGVMRSCGVEIVGAVSELGCAAMQGAGSQCPVGVRRLWFAGQRSAPHLPTDRATTCCATLLVASSALGASQGVSGPTVTTIVRAIRAGWECAFTGDQQPSQHALAAQRLLLQTLASVVKHNASAREYAMLKVPQLLRQAGQGVMYVVTLAGGCLSSHPSRISGCVAQRTRGYAGVRTAETSHHHVYVAGITTGEKLSAAWGSPTLTMGTLYACRCERCQASRRPQAFLRPCEPF